MVLNIREGRNKGAFNLNPAGLIRTANLVLLILRAGARDSLDWWEDESLTEAGNFALIKIFPRNPKQIAIRLAFLAAKQRQVSVLSGAGIQEATTLFHLTESFVFSNSAVGHIGKPITSPGRLKLLLSEIDPGIEALATPQSETSGLLDLTSLAEKTDQSITELTRILVSGFMRADKGNPVFPFIHLARKEFS